MSAQSTSPVPTVTYDATTTLGERKAPAGSSWRATRGRRRRSREWHLQSPENCCPTERRISAQSINDIESAKVAEGSRPPPASDGQGNSLGYRGYGQWAILPVAGGRAVGDPNGSRGLR